VSKKKTTKAAVEPEPEPEPAAEAEAEDKYADMKKLALMKLLRDRNVDYSNAGGVDDLR
jgi:hypothetical protein